MLTFLYRDLDATDTDITEFVVLRFGQNPQGMTSNAEERSVGAWDLQIEDNGVLDLHAQRTFYVFEDDTYDGDPVLWVGQTFDKHNGRGDTYRTGAGRVYTLSLVDLNTLLERRVIKSTDDPDRPEETDVERMLWLEGTGYIGLGTWISTDDPVDMDAVDYTGRMAAEVIEDCMGQSGKNSFMFRDPDTGGFSTFYGNSSADIDVLTSDIRISNVLSDIDEVTTWEALLDADLWEANSRIYSGVFANYDGGAVYQENATTVANFSHRDTTVSWPDVKSSTKANARAIRYLADIGTEEYRITVNIEVPSDQVGFMPHAGYRLQARFSHYPLFTEFTWMRILSRATTLIGPSRYRIQYELSPGTPAPPPIVCSTFIGDAQTMFDGDINSNPDFGSQTVPVTLTPSVYPSAIVTSFDIVNVGTQMGGEVTTAAPYTSLGSYNPTCTDNAHSLMDSAYRIVSSGDGGTYELDWNCGVNGWWAFAAVAIPTNDSAPVQSAFTVGTASDVNLPNPPTPGNILVLTRQTQSLSGGPISIVPTGWTQLVTLDSDHAAVDICVRCVEEGDGQTWGVSPGNPLNCMAISEWQLS